MSTAETRPPCRLLLATAVAVLTLLAAGCGASGTAEPDRGGTPRSPASPTSGGNWAMLSRALAEAGHESEAELLGDETTTVTEVRAPFLRQWRVLRVEARLSSHVVLFYVGWNGERVFSLTGNAGAFNRMISADRGRIGGPKTATSVATVYLNSTRSTATSFYIVGSVDDIRWSPSLRAAEQRKKQRIVSRYDSTIHPPRARADNGGYVVTAYVVHGQELQRHTLTIEKDGTVQQRVQRLVADLPVPQST